MNTYPKEFSQSYIHAVTQGAGWAPDQRQEAVSVEEREFRQRMEERKTRLLASRVEARHPVTLSEEQVERARRNIASAAWAARWFEEQKAIADFLLGQSDGFIEQMVPELTATSFFGFSCPRCAGTQSGEGFGSLSWHFQTPDIIACGACGQELPSPDYPETGRFACPRRNQAFEYYRPEIECEHPDDRTGQYAWKWVGKPMAVSFSGIVRERKIRFMFYAAQTSAQIYRITDETLYAQLAARILCLLAKRFPNWLYHDYFGAFADCDPLYAAAHDTALRLEYKRHPFETAYGGTCAADSADTPEKARMLSSYFGANRVIPSAGQADVFLGAACHAYDLTWGAKDETGRSVWSDEARSEVERNLILEYALEAEPWLGGPGRAECVSNLSPPVYYSFAAAGVCLGLPDYAHVGLSGFENMRDRRFCDDGISKESSLYMDAYVSFMVKTADILNGFRWPEQFAARSGAVDIFGNDDKFRSILLATAEQLRANGTWFPLSDTMPDYSSIPHVYEICAKHYPDFPAGLLPMVYANASDRSRVFSYKGWLLPPSDEKQAQGCTPTPYALFNLDADILQADTPAALPEIYFPSWMTAILRHGKGAEATDLALAFNPSGGHRHCDNLSLFYSAHGHRILGDLGYMCDTPFLGWYGSSFSHNLVIVDENNQIGPHAKDGDERRPALRWMATSPYVSAVEAESKVYPQCCDYRRTVALLKGPGEDTLAVDIFRVKGGGKHVYRLFSELAANDQEESGLDFSGIPMPPSRPLPNYRGSTKPEHVYGLIETRRANNPPSCWQAVWREPSSSYRLHFFTPVDAVIESHGPGQERRELDSQIGRRVRYLDAVREAADLSSVFVAVHEPTGANGQFSVIRAQRMETPPEAGADAVALAIETSWGSYRILSDFENEVEIEGIRFQGTFAVIKNTPDNRSRVFALGARTCHSEAGGFSTKTPWWECGAKTISESELVANAPPPADWPEPPENCVNHVLVACGEIQYGLPVGEITDRRFTVKRFPLPEARSLKLPVMYCAG